MPPKLFISYSWSSPEHEAWVIEFATQLRESGVDAILDKWHLREGDDAYAFMERMVQDPEIKKVILICDRKYVERANNRSGGVGAETQIIGPELYGKQSNSKFVAVVREKDEFGNACVPHYYKTRIYIDLSDVASFSDNFDRLLRWVFDKPLYIVPSIGKTPEFISESMAGVRLASVAHFRRALDAIKGDRSHAIAMLEEFFSLFAEEFEKFRIESIDGHLDDEIVKNVESFIPYRNELVELIASIAIYRNQSEA